MTGVVTVNGRPAFEARVMIVPANESYDFAYPFETLTNRKGEFAFGVTNPGDGLPAGKYDVRISYPEPTTDRDRLSGRYNSIEKAAFVIEVKDAKTVLPPFHLK